MEIGDITIGSDECPSCSGKMIKKPCGQRRKENDVPFFWIRAPFGFSIFCANCPACGYDGPEYKVRNDYLKEVKKRKSAEPVDITPYKWGSIGEALGIFK